MGPKVFISHRHSDQHVATQLDAILRDHGAETYLDQDQMQAGDDLPERIREGVGWCVTFLLIWSINTPASTWVSQEWNIAYEQRKKIIPYLLDSTPLPRELKNLIFVELEDQDHGHVDLLEGVFGKGFTPQSPYELFPGMWRAHKHLSGMGGLGQATYELELRANGQIGGVFKMDQSGLLGEIAGSAGFDLSSMLMPLRGDWAYDGGAQTLTLDIIASYLGQQTQETVQVRTTGREKGVIHGKDFAGCTWTLQRIS